MKKSIVILSLVLTVLVVLPRLVGQANEPDKKKVSDLMQRKLTNAEKILEGIAVNDFDKILKHAQNLTDISKQVEWRVLKTPAYEMYSNAFQRNNASLIRSAKDKNIDAAALAYVDLTLTCVKCHKHVREVRMVRAD